MRLFLIPAVALAATVAGCGSVGSASTSTAGSAPPSRTRTATVSTEASTAPATTTAPSNRAVGRGPHAAIPSPGPTPPRQPVKVPRAGDRSLQTFGSAATPSEFAAIAATVRSYDLALAEGNGAAACELLGPTGAAQLAKSFGAGKRSCAQLLTGLASRYPAQFRDSLRRVRVTDARVSGARGFAFFTMPTVPNGFFPVARDGGSWHVSALAGSNVS